MFPYPVTGTFPLSPKPNEIVVVTPTGAMHVPVS